MHALESGCDAAVLRSAPPCRPARHPNRALTALTIAAGMIFLDGSVIPVALPLIGRDLALQGSQTQWVLNAYLLPLATLAMLGGALGDRFGRRQILLLGTLLFTLATIGCATAAGFGALMATRFLQGIGAALLYPNSLSAIGQLFSGSEQGRAVGIWSSVAAVVSGAAPPVAGWFIDQGNWRMAFLLNIPLAMLAVAFTYRYIPDDFSKIGAPLDALGSLMGAVGLGLIIWQLTDEPSVTTFVLAIAVMTAFVWYENRLGTGASLPIALLTSRLQLGINTYTFLLYVPFNLFLIYVPFVLLRALHRTATETGLALVPLQIIFIVISPFMSRVVERFGLRLPLAAGAALTAAGCLLVLMVASGGSYWSGLFPAVLLLAAGMSLAAAPLTALVLSSVDKEHMGAASGLNSAVARFSSLVSAALLSTIFVQDSHRLLSAFPIVMGGAAVSSLLAAVSTLLIRRGS